jgi:OFA family oxalate/formate antiporter-like MFS transporter
MGSHLKDGLTKRVYYGWYVAGAASGIEFANAATAIAILTIFIIPMTDEFGWTRTQLSAATSLGAVLGATLAPITGRLVDRNGARLPLVLGGVLVASACMYLASVQTLLGFYVAFAITRTADQGLIKIGAPPAVGKWFDRHRGRAIALVFFGGSAGIVLLAPVVQLVIGAWGWRAAWRLLGALMLCLGVVPCLALIRRPPQGQETDPDPRLAPEPTPGGSHRLETSAGDIVSQGNVWSLGSAALIFAAVAAMSAFFSVMLSRLPQNTNT